MMTRYNDDAVWVTPSWAEHDPEGFMDTDDYVCIGSEPSNHWDAMVLGLEGVSDTFNVEVRLVRG